MFHAFYGIYIAFTAKNNPKNFGTLRNYIFILQRFTGIFLVVFIAWHVFETRFQAAIGAKEVNFNMMAEILSNPWMLGFYIVGVISATFHLANGIWSFLVSWGITQSTTITTNCYLCNISNLLSVICSWCTSTFSIRIRTLLYIQLP